MATYSYTPAYYSSFHDSITSLCKSILQPLSLRSRRRLPEQKLAERHSDSLKWQQDSFHRILHLTGLHNEGIIPESELSAFRSHLLDTLISAPSDPEPSAVIRDKLLFLQELFHTKCISSEEYHSSKRPLLQRLAVQGVEVDCRDVIVGAPSLAAASEEWSVLDLTPEKQRSPGIKSLIGKTWRVKGSKGVTVPDENHPSILLAESSPLVLSKSEKTKRRPFRALFYKERDAESPNGTEERVAKTAKKSWGFDGLKKWKKGNSDEEPLTLSATLDDGSSSVPCTVMAASSVSEGTGTKEAIDNVSKMETLGERDGDGCESWVSFEENDENFHPNLFIRDAASSIRGADVTNVKLRDSGNHCFMNNPFHDGKLRDSRNDCFQNNPFHDAQNPFLSPRG